jgi:hypothetical protein
VDHFLDLSGNKLKVSPSSGFLVRVKKKHMGALGILHCSFQGAVIACGAFVRVVGHFSSPSKQKCMGATL